ncbi:SNF2 family N-terminal domain-containing protein [Trichoderma pleuroticola]
MSKSPRLLGRRDAPADWTTRPAKRICATKHGIDSHRSTESPSERTPECFESLDTDEVVTCDQNETICYGTLFDAKAQSGFVAGLHFSRAPWARFHTVKVDFSDDKYYLVQSTDASEIQFAVLDVVTISYLNKLYHIPNLYFSAVISVRELDRIPRKSTPKKVVIDVTVNIHGPEDFTERVGETLGSVSAYLQHPVFLESGIRYVNPHYLYPDDIMTDLSHLSLLSSLGVDTMSGSQQRGVETLLGGHLANTHLKDHQLDGVKFILSREDWSFCHKTNRELLASTYKLCCLVSNNSTPCLGGILADVMGLGKTLTMLSAVVCTKAAATEYCCSTIATKGAPKLTKSTLVVLPSRQVLDSWDNEVKSRFGPLALTVGHFHGDKRAKMSEQLLHYDVVLTTYHTLPADWKGQKVLFDFSWFRIVLDEAHSVKNQATQIFKAVESLEAQRRWCLTGTPIQNNLHDLRAMLRFLRHGPLSSARLFDKHIIGPIREETDDSLRNLRLLLRSVCLRRGDEYLDIPKPRDEIISVNLSPTERAEYQKILKDYSDLKTQDLLFVAIMKLRRLCNNGTIRLGPDKFVPWKLLNGEEPESRTSNGCEICDMTEEAFPDGVDNCPSCGQLLPLPTIPRLQDLGLDPLISFTDDRCTWWTPLDASTSMGSEKIAPNISPPVRALADGYSSKLMTVIQNICRSSITSGAKSIIFTSWRDTIDILGALLTERGVLFSRIDGRTSPTERTVKVSEFQHNPKILVLLMTINSGAVGLTLTRASQVHIVEPHWNPALEKQAIARALRVGQTQPVTIFKYITEKTVEKV